MALINITTPSDGETADASDVATPLNTIVSEFNGNIDNANIKTGAAIATSKLATDAGIVTGMLADGTVTSSKLAENFLRGRLQANTTNTAPTGLTLQHGWGFIVGDTTTKIEETITFPTSFASAPIVLVSYLGAASTTTPSAIGDFTSDPATVVGITANDIIGASFQVHLFTASGSFGNSNAWGYTWVAIGTV